MRPLVRLKPTLFLGPPGNQGKQFLLVRHQALTSSPSAMERWSLALGFLITGLLKL